MMLINGMKTCFSLMGRHKYAYWLSTISDLITSYGGDVFFALLNKNIINAVISTNFSAFKSALWLGAIALGLFLINVFTRFFKMRSIRYIMRDMRVGLFGHMERLSVEYFENNHSGDSIFRLNSNVEIMKQAYANHFSNILLGIIGGIGSCIFILILDWRLGLISITTCVVTFYVNVKLSNPLRVLGGKIQRAESTLLSYLSDLLAGYSVIKLFGAGRAIVGRYEKQNEEAADMRLKRAARVSSVESINHFLDFINNFVLIVIGALFAVFKMTDFGTVFAILTVQGNVSGMLLRFSTAWGLMQESFAAAEMIHEVLDAEQEVEYEPNSHETNHTAKYIEFSGVSFSYEEGINVLDNLNLSIDKGKVAALVGPSGGGKSTVIKLLMRFYDIGSGRVSINEKSIYDYSLSSLRRLISYVPQDAYLFDENVMENIRYGKPGATDEEVIEASKLANVHDFVTEMPGGYKTFVGERGESLSGGQRQRIAIARAFLKNAPILLLDEATSALDTENERYVQASIERLMQNRTTIVVAHRLSTIENADEIYVISRGKVVQRGTHDDLIAEDGVYRELIKLSDR